MARILVVFGTRPEAIKMFPVVHQLRATEGIETLVAVTAQHRELLDQVLDIAGILPDVDLDLMRANRWTSFPLASCSRSARCSTICSRIACWSMAIP